MRRRIIFEWVQIIAGLFIFAFGVHLTIYANIGLAPWDCLGMGISHHTPLNYGLAMTVTALVVLGIDLMLKERIGFGTVIDALLTGNFVQLFNSLNPLPLNSRLWMGSLIMLAGFVFMSIGMAVYMKGGQCCGPRDSLLVGIGKRLPRIPIGFVEILLWAVVLMTGWLLGGPVGPGTVISTFGAGIVMQAVYSFIHFEPRDIKHRDVLEVSRLLLQDKMTAGAAFIWDLDGTLLDSYGVIVSGLYETCREYHIRAEKSEILKEVITHSVSAFITEMEKRSGIPSAALAARNTEISSRETMKIQPTKNAREILSYIREQGIPQFVFTHRGASAKEILENTGLSGFFTEVITGKDGYPRKPDPSALCYLVQKYGLEKARSFYVGDRTIDMECADNAGIQSILYLPEGSPGSKTGKETCVVKDLLEIKKIVRHR